MDWSACGLSADSVSDQASWQAYIALTLSSIESAIRLPKKAILSGERKVTHVLGRLDGNTLLDQLVLTVFHIVANVIQLNCFLEGSTRQSLGCLGHRLTCSRRMSLINDDRIVSARKLLDLIEDICFCI